MRFSGVLLASTVLHGYVLWAVESSRQASLPLARGEHCIEMTASFASLPSPQRDEPRREVVEAPELVLSPKPVEKTEERPQPIEKLPPPVEVPPEEPGPLPKEPIQPRETVKEPARPSAPSPPMPEQLTVAPAPLVEAARPNKSSNPTELPASKPQPASKASAPRQQGVTQGANLPNHYRPVYPREAQIRGIEGRVVLAIHLSARGDATEVNVQESSGYEILDAAAERFVRSVRFNPARSGSTAVETEVTLPVIYRLRD